MNLAYVRGQIEPALRVARFDRNSVHEFDQTIEGFFRSFYGVIICAPIYLIIILSERRIAADAVMEMPNQNFLPPPPVTFLYVLIETGVYLINWIAFPILMIFLARLIGAGNRYLPFVIAYNWSSCVLFGITSIPYLLYLTGIVPIYGVLFFGFPVLLYWFANRWLVAAEGLQIAGMTAAGIVIFDYLLSLFIELGTAQLFAVLSATP